MPVHLFVFFFKVHAHMLSHDTPCPPTTIIDKFQVFRYYPYTVFTSMESSIRCNITLQSMINIPVGESLIELEYEVNTPRTTKSKFRQFFFYVKIPQPIKVEVKCHVACPEKQQDNATSEFGGGLQSIWIMEEYNGEQDLENVSHNKKIIINNN